MKYSLRYVLNKTITTFCKILMWTSIRLECLAPSIKKGIYLVRAEYGHTIEIDGVTLDFDLTYSDANNLCDTMIRLRKRYGEVTHS